MDELIKIMRKVDKKLTGQIEFCPACKGEFPNGQMRYVPGTSIRVCKSNNCMAAVKEILNEKV